MKKAIEEGKVHIYTGSGKGKTTASLGLGLRAAAAGLRVCVFQFLKKRGTTAEGRLAHPRFRVVCFNEAHPMFSGDSEKLKKDILCDIKKAKRALKSGRYDVVILDEIINCVSGKFVPERVVLALVRSRPKRVELVLTGRGATKRLIACADYVSRINKIKHPFDKGLLARRGIEF
ncbi:MAG: cob(I)yrinic acid a,c-diamide adenosyltransferase [Candidatus Omnitrophica bacterium]|nr:cob(I)yrinic acid a,c-diamide adenosyltransferase [Candidatus Omnitrophota bacterium]